MPLVEGDDVVLREGRVVDDVGQAPPSSADAEGRVLFSMDRITPQQGRVQQDAQYDQPSKAMVFNDGRTLRLSGNAWKSLEHPYTVTPNTVLEAEFRTTHPGEIHAIGFDNSIDTGGGAWQYGAFQLFGSESVPHVSRQYIVPEAGRWVRVKIPVGRHYTGRFDRLLFVCDDDAAGAADSWFRNVRVYEQENADQP
jgi:hypothetical protein